jgi:hypothetical protein
MISVAMDTLIRICLKHPHVFQELLAEKNVKAHFHESKLAS